MVQLHDSSTARLRIRCVGSHIPLFITQTEGELRPTGSTVVYEYNFFRRSSKSVGRLQLLLFHRILTLYSLSFASMVSFLSLTILASALALPQDWYEVCDGCDFVGFVC